MRINLIPMLALPILLSLSGCAKYQYAFVDSSIYNDQSSSYIIDDDSITITYSFAGPDLRMTAKIFNKQALPVYIDLERSLIICNGKQYNNVFSGAGGIGFIAPNSYVTLVGNPVALEMVDLSGHDSVTQVRTTGGLAKSHQYTRENTPVQIRSIVAVASNEYYDQPTFYDTPFWIKEIVPTTMAPSGRIYAPGEKFYLKKENEAGKVLGWTLILLISIAAAGATG